MTRELMILAIPVLFLIMSIVITLHAKFTGYDEWKVLLAICNMAGNICFMASVIVFEKYNTQLLIAYGVYAVVVMYITVNMKR